MLFLLALLVSLDSFSAEVKIGCEPIKDGWLPYNYTESKFIGKKARYFKLNTCIKAVATLVEAENDFAIMCSASYDGSTIFNAQTGEPIANPNSYFMNLDLCSKSLSIIQDWVVCIPSQSAQLSSDLYDLREGRTISNYGYTSLEYCAEAGLSATSSDHFVCSAGATGAVIMDRRTNRRVGTDWFASTRECRKSIRN